MEEKREDIKGIKVEHPLFQGASEQQLNLCKEKYYLKNEVIIHPNRQRKGIYLLVKGIAEVYVKNDQKGKDEVLEVLQQGELFGFSSLVHLFDGDIDTTPLKAESKVVVRAVEPVHAIYIPHEVLSTLWKQPFVHEYLLVQVAARLKDVYTSLAEQVTFARSFGETDVFVLRVQDLMCHDVISCSPQHTIQEVAQKMVNHRVSSVIVMEDNQQIGIITERDVVNRVVANNHSATEDARRIMTSNPYTISRVSYYYEALSLMLVKGVKHLLVMDQQQLVGMITLSDLLRKKNENMIKTIRRIENADVHALAQVKEAIYEVLETLLKEKVPIIDTLDVITTLYDRLMKRAVELAVSYLEEAEGLVPPVAFNLYAMGSSGRGEQFMLTDQDHFLVFEDCELDTPIYPYFQKLGIRIVAYLEQAGYARCKGLMMSSEADWRGTISDWKWRVHKWAAFPTNDNLLLANNFFSYRMVYGEPQLHEMFQQKIAEALQMSKMFLYHLTEVEVKHPITTLDHPIRSLFKLSKKSIDMKKEILFPYHHSLQILSLIHDVHSGTPIERIEALMEKGVLGPNFVKDLKEAINQVLSFYVYLRWQQAKTGDASSSILSFHSLTTREKEELIISLKTLKTMQNKVFYHFNMKV